MSTGKLLCWLTPAQCWDLVVVGAGPAGATAALAAVHERPDARVLLLDRADFPRDKACGDGIAPHVLGVLDRFGLGHIVDDWTPVPDLELARGDLLTRGTMRRPARAVPRAVFDSRLVDAASPPAPAPAIVSWCGACWAGTC